MCTSTRLFQPSFFFSFSSSEMTDIVPTPPLIRRAEKCDADALGSLVSPTCAVTRQDWPAHLIEPGEISQMRENCLRIVSSHFHTTSAHIILSTALHLTLGKASIHGFYNLSVDSVSISPTI